MAINSDVTYRLLDKEGQIVFDSASWSEAFSKNPLLPSHVNRLKPRTQQSIVLDQGFVIRCQPLLDEYATAPGGTLMILENGQVGMPPLNPLEAADMFREVILMGSKDPAANVL